MASIYDKNGEYLTQGLQGSALCDQAIKAARELAESRNEVVYLDDDGDFWAIHPDGTKTKRGTGWMITEVDA